MQSIDEYYWAQDKIDEVVTGKKHREAAACERRLRQIKSRREKEAARAKKKADETQKKFMALIDTTIEAMKGK